MTTSTTVEGRASGSPHGYALLARHFSKLAAAGPGEYEQGSPEWESLADDLEEAFARGRRDASILWCGVVEEVRDEIRQTRFSRLKDRLGLLGCASALVGAVTLIGVLVRGVVALWADFH